METPFDIRTAGIEDITTIRNLAYAIWPAAYGAILVPAQIGYMLQLLYSAQALQEQMSRHHFLLAHQQGRQAGFAAYSPAADPGVYKLHKLYVLPGLQGLGLGRALMQAVIDAIRPLEASALDLNVNRQNKARHFYKRLGFVIIREEDISIGSGYYMNDYVMRLNLEA